jgi:hypothetical protein
MRRFIQATNNARDCLVGGAARGVTGSLTCSRGIRPANKTPAHSLGPDQQLQDGQDSQARAVDRMTVELDLTG